ncbi:hypothetical protein [Motilimonas pumila]|nr:hypothetical protein [Motilimonas pumila]
MKIIIFIAIIAATFYLHKNGYLFKEEVQFSNYNELLAKVEEQPVTMEEVKKGSNMLATRLCNDEHFQETGGSSVKKCLKTYQNFKGMCEERIFTELEQLITTKDEIMRIAKRYVACVGIE